MSGFDWSGSAEGGAQAETIPNGDLVPVTISKIVYGKKGGQPFQSKSGDPQIMVVFRDLEEREASQMFTLSKKAAWTLARLMHRFGVDLDGLAASGIEPHHFAEKHIADNYLIGRKGRINIRWPIVDGVVSKYPEIEPCEQVASAEVPSFDGAKPRSAEAVEIKESDVPF